MKEPEIILEAPGEPTPQVLRRILNLGHILLVSLLLTWVLLLYYRGRPYQHTGWLALSQLISGRAGAVGLGLRLNFSAWYMFFQVAMVDFILMLYVYPLFVRGYQHLTRIPVVGDWLENMHKVALEHKTRMAPYGALGLVIFVIFPFWSTGCMVGAIVGYLIGLPTWLSLTSVTLGNLSAIALWIVFYERLQNWNPNVAMALLVVIFVLAVAGILYARIKRNQKLREEEELLALYSPGQESKHEDEPPTYE